MASKCVMDSCVRNSKYNDKNKKNTLCQIYAERWTWQTNEPQQKEATTILTGRRHWEIHFAFAFSLSLGVHARLLSKNSYQNFSDYDVISCNMRSEHTNTHTRRASQREEKNNNNWRNSVIFITFTIPLVEWLAWRLDGLVYALEYI